MLWIYEDRSVRPFIELFVSVSLSARTRIEHMGGYKLADVKRARWARVNYRVIDSQLKNRFYYI